MYILPYTSMNQGSCPHWQSAPLESCLAVVLRSSPYAAHGPIQGRQYWLKGGRLTKHKKSVVHKLASFVLSSICKFPCCKWRKAGWGLGTRLQISFVSFVTYVGVCIRQDCRASSLEHSSPYSTVIIACSASTQVGRLWLWDELCMEGWEQASLWLRL